MFRYSILTLFGLVAIAAVVCAIVFQVPKVVRVPILFAGITLLPGPLAVALWRGGPAMKSFALGGLLTYAAWFLIAGVPCGVIAAGRFFGPNGYSSGSNIVWEIEIIATTYPGYVGLYAPWILVSLGGVISMIAYQKLQRPTQPSCHDPKEKQP